MNKLVDIRGQPRTDGTQPCSSSKVLCQECLKYIAAIPDQPTKEEWQKSTLTKSRYNIQRHFRKYHTDLPVEGQKEITDDMCYWKRHVWFQLPIESTDTVAEITEAVQQPSSETGVSVPATQKKGKEARHKKTEEGGTVCLLQSNILWSTS